MINFFRQIRKQLADNNQFLKYSRYAVGEIALVVIGILIALQINNWNQNRKNQILLTTYKVSLVEDLTKDTIELNNTIYEMERELEKLLVIGIKISNQSINIDSVIKIYRYEFSPLINASNNFYRNTIEGLLATGNINLMEKDLYNSLMSLYDLQNKAIQIINVNLGFYMNYSTRVNLSFNDEISAVKGKVLDQIWKDLDKSEFLKNFNTKLSSKILGYQGIIEIRKELLGKTESALKLLENSIQ